MMLKLQSMYVSSFFEFDAFSKSTAKSTNTGIVVRKQDERWLCLDIFFLASRITIYYVPGKSKFQRNLHLQVICHFQGMKQMIRMIHFCQCQLDVISPVYSFECMNKQLLCLFLCTHALCNVKGECHIIYENTIDCTHQHFCLIFSLSVWQFLACSITQMCV